ncbi:MAG TPA: hemolysin family protein [Gemmatimonadales bacterium]
MIAVVALVSVVWAALFTVAEGAPGIHAALGDPPVDPGNAVPLQRAYHAGRRALLIVGGAATGLAYPWWAFGPIRAALSITLTAGLLYMIADALPRALATLMPEMATRAARIARRTLGPFRPLLGMVAAADRGAHRIFPTARQRAGALGARQRKMLEGVKSLAESTVEDIMTPRLDIAAIDERATWAQVVKFVRRSEHSRIPVYRDSLDDIIGILHAKDLAPLVTRGTLPGGGWQSLLRPAAYVPSTKPLTVQLRDFQRGALHLAIIVDEFGGTSGLVTLEDILEEVVGEIHDEHDVDEAPLIVREGDGKFWVDSRVGLDDLAELLENPFARDEVSTVGGLVYAELGHVPEAGEELRIGEFRVVVEDVVGRRITRVYFERLPRDEEAAAPSERGVQP